MNERHFTSHPLYLTLLFVGIVGVLLMLFSTATKNTKPDETQALTDSRPLLTAWVTYNDDQFHAYRKIVEDFEQENNVTIKLSRIPFGGQEEKFQYACTSHTTPDIARMDIGIIPRFAVGKALVELDKYFAEYPWLQNDLLPAAVESGRVRMENGQMKLFGIPDELSLLALFYNRDLFEESGLAPDSPPQTWADFKKVGVRLTVDANHDGNPDRYAFSMENTLWWSLPFIYSYGGDIIDEENMVCLLDKEPAVKALSEQIELFRMGIESGSWKKGAYLPDARFKDQSTAMIFSGPWNLRSFDRVNFDLALIPGSDSKKSSTAIGGNSNVIFRSCKYPDLAAKFLAYLTTEAIQEFFMRELKSIPLNTKVSIPKGQDKSTEYLRIFTEQAKYAQPRPRIPNYGRIETIVNQETETAFRGDRTPQEAYARACAQIDREILSELRQESKKRPNE